MKLPSLELFRNIYFIKRKSLLILTIFIILIYSTFSQDKIISLGSGYGAFANYNLNYYKADFYHLPDVPNCCPKFESGSGSGMSLGLVYDKPLANIFGIQLRAGYSGLNGSFSVPEASTFALNDSTIQGEFEHNLDIKLATVGIEPMFYYKIFGNLKLNIGFNAALLITKKYNQIEQITKPIDKGTFLNALGQDSKSRERFHFSGDINQANSFQLSISGGIGYEMPLNKDRSLILNPEIFYNYGITPVIKSYVWNVNFLRIGFALLYSTTKIEFIKTEKEPADYDKRILAMAQEYELVGNSGNLIYGTFNQKDNDLITKTVEAGMSAGVKAVGVTDSIEDDKATLRIEEFLSNNLRPLLNYLFFDKNSSELPSRYKLLSTANTGTFDIEKLNKSGKIETYYQCLNIIGIRLQKYPNAKITLTGCNSDNEKEKGNKELSGKRAETVKNYLSNVWKISKDRIKVESRNLPDSYSNNKVNDGNEENRRVEIYSDTWEITEPILTSDTLIMASPPTLRFYLKAKSEKKISSWRLTAMQNGVTLKTFEGKDMVPARVDWRIDKEKETIPRFDGEVSYKLEVTDITGNKVSSSDGKLPLEQITIRKKQENRVGDKRIDRYSLILFQFASSELSDANKRISDFIKSRVEPNSKLLISGYTDRMGDFDKNLQLSEDRAKTVGKFMESNLIYTRPMGSKELLYDNNLPEGRFYCRTVEIDVETPIKW